MLQLPTGYLTMDKPRRSARLVTRLGPGAVVRVAISVSIIFGALTAVVQIVRHLAR